MARACCKNGIGKMDKTGMSMKAQHEEEKRMAKNTVEASKITAITDRTQYRLFTYKWKCGSSRLAGPGP